MNRQLAPRGPARLWTYALLGFTLCLLLLLPRAAFAQAPDPVAELMRKMSDEEKVGQLFVVAFVGDSADPSSDIGRLVKEFKIGGVVLLANNNNFRNDENTPSQVARLANDLQALAFAQGDRPGIPLFVAIDHEGDGFPYSRLRDGTTPLPSAMAVGATWQPENAEAVGRITGRELSAMGVNLLLGPVVDVLNNPRLTTRGDIGVRAFGGDPFWVSKMGRAYIQGVHAGSNGRLAVVAKHFPGHGGSDRLPDKEVATVDKSLSELRRIELPPFFAVTQVGAALTPTLSQGERGSESAGSSPQAIPPSGVQVEKDSATADALMSSHIRYSGFQGNIRQLTAPISFDAEAMRAILSMPEFVPWREQGGLIVSDSLGVDAVRKYYDPQLLTFPHKRIAREAFLAGNEVLILAQFALRNVWLDQLSNIEETVQFFRGEYRANPDFRQRVDDAVAKILRLKMKLYPGFSLPAVQVDVDQAKKEVGQGQETVTQIAREALTLVFPRTPQELRARMPSPPRRDEDILIFTDARDDTRECYAADCQPFALIPVDAISNTIGAIYGPKGLGQIDPERIHSHTFAELNGVLTRQLNFGEGPLPTATAPVDSSSQPPPTPVAIHPPSPTPPPSEVEQKARQAELEKQIQEAEWIIFAMLDVNGERMPDSDAIRLFLARGSAALYDKKIVALSFNAPYYLDTTEVNKLTAYFAAYSKQPAFVDTAVRALFGDFTPTGASPVSIEGVNYDLARALEPDPDQKIPVALVEPAAGAKLQAPVIVRVRAGPILDHNGRPVPDRSPVEFQAFDDRDQINPAATARVDTDDGVAEATLRLDRGSIWKITVVSNAAMESDKVEITVDAPPTPTPVQPGPTRIMAPATSPASTPTEAPGEMSALPPTAHGGMPGTAQGRAVGIGDLLLALAGIAAAAGLTVVAGRSYASGPSARLRLVLLACIGGLAGYVVYALAAQTFGEAWTGLRPWAAGAAALACGILPGSVDQFVKNRPRLKPSP